MRTILIALVCIALAPTVAFAITERSFPEEITAMTPEERDLLIQLYGKKTNEEAQEYFASLSVEERSFIERFFGIPLSLITPRLSSGKPTGLCAGGIGDFAHIIAAFERAPEEPLAPGTRARFNVSLLNRAHHPIANSTLFVRIYREGSDPDTRADDVVVDEISVPVHRGLLPAESISVPVTFRIPSHAVSGTYRAVLFVVTGSDFETLGISRDVSGLFEGPSTTFAVSSNDTSVNVSLRYAETRINKNSVDYFSRIPIVVETLPPTNVSVLVENSGTAPTSLVAQWEVYPWGLPDAGRRIEVSETAVMFDPGEGRVLSYDVDDTNFGYYFVRLVLTAGGEPVAVGHFSFVRNGNALPRFNNLTISEFPLRSFDAATVLGCVETVGVESVDDVQIAVHIEDAAGRIFGGKNKSVTVPTRATPAAVGFTPTRDAWDFTVVTQLIKNGTVLDEERIRYSCREFPNTEGCGVPVMWYTVGSIAMLLIIAGGFGYILHRRRKKSAVEPPIPPISFGP